jgi:hypothetical protein
MGFLRPDELASIRAVAQTFLPEQCTITRLLGDGGPVAVDTPPCRVDPGQRELYPFAAIPNQPVSAFRLVFPAETNLLPNDLISFAPPDQRIYVVIHTLTPTTDEVQRVAVCVLSATGGQLGDAYVRPNSTVTCTRPGFEQTGRRLHLAFAQAIPQAKLETLQKVGGATISASLFDLPDADWRQGDGVTLANLSGITGDLQLINGRLQGVVRRPLPYAVLEADVLFNLA